MRKCENAPKEMLRFNSWKSSLRSNKKEISWLQLEHRRLFLMLLKMRLIKVIRMNRKGCWRFSKSLRSLRYQRPQDINIYLIELKICEIGLSNERTIWLRLKIENFDLKLTAGSKSRNLNISHKTMTKTLLT